MLCNNAEPKEFLNEFIDGEYRNLIEAIIPVIIAAYSVPIAIAIPIAALVTKKGINKFCKKHVKHIIESEEIKEIVENKTIESEVYKKLKRK